MSRRKKGGRERVRLQRYNCWIKSLDLAVASGVFRRVGVRGDIVPGSYCLYPSFILLIRKMCKGDAEWSAKRVLVLFKGCEIGVQRVCELF